MIPVTMWYRWSTLTAKWEYCHYEDGHIEEDVPKPRHPDHEKSWSKHTNDWLKRFGTRTDELVPKVTVNNSDF